MGIEVMAVLKKLLANARIDSARALHHHHHHQYDIQANPTIILYKTRKMQLSDDSCHYLVPAESWNTGLRPVSMACGHSNWPLASPNWPLASPNCPLASPNWLLTSPNWVATSPNWT